MIVLLKDIWRLDKSEILDITWCRWLFVEILESVLGFQFPRCCYLNLSLSRPDKTLLRARISSGGDVAWDEVLPRLIGKSDPNLIFSGSVLASGSEQRPRLPEQSLSILSSLRAIYCNTSPILDACVLRF
jgi:hypothetical protein